MSPSGAGGDATAAAAARAAAVADLELVRALGRTTTPVLLLYGDADPACPLSHAQAAFNALQCASPASQLVVYEGAAHSLSSCTQRLDGNRRVCEWARAWMPNETLMSP
jgi:alpha-beta hydrolase superfamily lysophospholipase